METQQEAAASAEPITPETEAKLSKARVEKLKRRIIRAVAAKTSQNPDENEMENMWEMMKRSSKCDCKVLWKHMRAVTLKKLKRLLPADDRIENITAIARLTITDWLLFDLVLVHEDIDVIGRDIWENNGEEPEPLMELFFLVDEYNIERLKGTDLIDAWLKLTREYNDGGRKCSPMLLQRRWYQMKEAARKRFYNFWANYRGNASLMAKAKRFQPTALQVDIVRKNKHLIVSTFTEWNELIEKGRVILANEFDNRINAQRKNSTTDAGPELEVIEQNVEIISLEGISDEDDSKDATSCEISLQNNVTIKREPEDDDLIEIHDNNIDILQSINIPCETPFGNNENEHPPLVMSDYAQTETNEGTQFVDNSYQIKNKEETDISKSASDGNEILEESCNIDNEVSAKTVSDPAAKGVCNDLKANSACDVLSDSDDVELIDIFNSSKLVIETPFLNKSPEGDILKQETYIETGNNRDEQAEQWQEQTNLDCLPRIENVTSIAQSEITSVENKVKSILAQKANELELNKDCCLTENNDSSNNSKINDLSKVVVEKIATDRDFLGNFEELPSDIHFVDDGIALDDDVEDSSDLKVQVKEETNDEINEETESATIDLKLLLLPVVYTKKLDHMDVFKFIEYNHIQDGRIIECASVESKPVDSKSVKLEDISPLKHEEHNSARLGSDSSDQEDTLLQIEHQQKDITIETDIQSDKESVSSCEEDTPLNTLKNRVHIKSWLLKKPRVQNYNPIQLCKNPDFNTRLKRLTAGFLSYERNRHYLKRCHPLTIDLHKAFEDKLTNNTLYLKGVDLISNKPAPLTENAITQPISISSPPVSQNVSMDNEDDFIDIISNSPMPCERNKVISLPDITEIRRLNQKLLTAEVAPLQIATTSPPEMNATDAINLGLIDQNKPSTHDVHNTSTINNLVPSNDSCDKQDSPKIDAPVDKSFIASSDSISEDRSRIRPTISGSDKSISGKNQQKSKPHKKHSLYSGVTWISKPAQLREEEFLLASDTVDKMLYLFTGEDITKKKETPRFIKEHINKSKDVQEKCFKDYKFIEKMDLNDSTAISLKEKEKPVNDTDQDLLLPKKMRKKRFCCWASKKYSHPNIKQRHPCKKPLCTCCCKEKLINKVVFGNVKQPFLNEPIILSDEEKVLGKLQTPKKICVVNVVHTKTDTELPNAKSIVIDGKTNKVNVPNHLVRNNTRSIDENNVINYEQSTLVANNMNNNPNQSNLQIHNTTDTLDNSSELPYGFSVAISETVVAQDGTRIYNTEQTTLPSIPPLLESLPPCEDPKMTITVKALNQPNSSNGNTVPNHYISHSVSDVTPLISEQPLEVPPLAVPALVAPLKPVVKIRKVQTGALKKSPHKPLELPNRTVRVKVRKREKLSSAPIFVGDNKILLSSVKSPHPSRLSIDPPKISLPNGVHFVLLPNNELALSIVPGVELNTHQLSHLQTVIQTLQKFLGVPSQCMNIVDSTPIVIDDDEKQNPLDIETENQIESVNQLENNPQLALTNSCTEEKNITSAENENNKFANDEKHENVELNNVEPNIVEPNIVEPNIVEPNIVEPNIVEPNIAEPNIAEPNIAEPNSVEPNIVEHNKDIDSTTSNTEREFVNENDNLEKTSNDISRKTILSDLMEMSGICEEDAKLPEIPVLPTITPDIDLTPLEIAEDESVSKMHPDILKLFNTPTALAALASRPDLSIVTTYSDLKYAFLQDAKFFKLDVTSGDIFPINVFIKNKETIKSSLNPPKRSTTELIDLTDDDQENYNVFFETEASDEHVKNSADTAVTPSEATPLKLFRSMHSSILRNKMNCKGTELITNAVRSGNLCGKLNGKRILKIVNTNRRKQNLNELTRFDFETAVDVEKTQKTPQPECVLPSQYISDDSDDEPLAKKSRRNKQEQNSVDQQLNIESTESIDLPIENPALVEVANPMMYEALDPEFGSFENDCEEDCILGV